MGHAAGQLADRLELLRLVQRRFSLGQRGGAFFHALFQGGIQLGDRGQALAYGGVGAHTFYVCPGALGDFAHQRQVVR